MVGGRPLNRALDVIRRHALWIVSFGILVGFLHYFAQSVAASAVTSCFYQAQSCKLAQILVPVVGFPVFTFGLAGPDLGRQMIVNSMIWALGASALASAAIHLLIRRD